MFAGNFAPRSFAMCDGQLLAVSQNEALFSLLGTIYGGDGRTTFGLPDLRGRVPIHFGNGPGLTPRSIGSRSGSENVTLIPANLPAHAHGLSASGAAGESKGPGQKLSAKAAEPAYGDSASPVAMSSTAVSSSGGGQPHPNLMPFQCISFIIALAGVYPSRN